MNLNLPYFQIVKLSFSSTLLMICNYMKPTIKTINISGKISINELIVHDSHLTHLALLAGLTK